MDRNRFIRFFSWCVIAILLAGFQPNAKAEVILPIEVSDSYKSGPYYTNLINTLEKYANAPMVERFVQVALSQKGYMSGKNAKDLAGTSGAQNRFTEYTRYMNRPGEAWCASFVSWCAAVAGIPESIVGQYAGCGNHRKQALRDGTAHKIWDDTFTTYIDYKPRVGDLVLFTPTHDCPGKEDKHYNGWNESSHIAIVAEVFDRNKQGGWRFKTIERTDEIVGQRTISTHDKRGSGSCQCFGEHNAWVVQMFISPPWNDYVDKKTPNVSNFRVSNVTKDGYTVSCNVQDDVQVKSVRFKTWTKNGGEASAVWHNATISGHTATAYIRKADIGGSYNNPVYTHVYADDPSGNTGTLKPSSSYMLDYTPPTLLSKEITDVTANGFWIHCTFTDDRGVVSVRCPVWTDYTLKADPAEQDDLVWYDAKIEGNKASCYVSTANHNHEDSTYVANIFLTDAMGNQTVDVIQVYVEDKEPVIENLRITDATSTGFNIRFSFSDDGTVSKVQCPVWTDYTLKADPAEQDDIVWHTPQITGNSVVCPVDIASHNNELATYVANVLVTDNAGQTTVGLIKMTVENEPPKITGMYIDEVTEAGFRLHCSFSDNIGVTSVRLPVWTDKTMIADAAEQDDLVWHKPEIAGNTASTYVKTSEHNNELGWYVANILLSDACGNSCVDVISVFIESDADMRARASIDNIQPTSYDVSYQVVDGIKQIRFKTWNSMDGQNGAVWSDPTISNGKASVTIRAADHANRLDCTYTTEVYIWDKKGNEHKVTLPGIDLIDLSSRCTFVLPGSLISIEAEGLVNTSAQVVFVPAGCKSIQSRAFADCKQLEYIYLPSGISIADDAFAGCSPILQYQ